MSRWTQKDASVAADSDEWNIEVNVRSCGTLTPWQLLIRERHESIPMLGHLTLLNLSVIRTAQPYNFAAKRDKLMPLLALVSMHH